MIPRSLPTQLSLSAEDYDRTQGDLRELVQLRNNLVHHFIDQHDLWSIDGCRAAHDALVAACERIGKHFEHTERSPERQPKKYGCASWRQVLHESRLFELRYRDLDGQRAACYRVHAD